MSSALIRYSLYASFVVTLLFAQASVTFAQKKPAQATVYIRAVYKGGLELHEEPVGTVLANPSVCIPKDGRYDYASRLADTVAKANIRLKALHFDQKISGYTAGVQLLDRNIALINGTLQSLKKLDGLSGYLIPVGALRETPLQGAKFEGKCYKAPGGEYSGPDALGERKSLFDSFVLFGESSMLIDKALKEELPKKLGEFAALEKEKAVSKQEKKSKEERFGALTDEVMKKVGDFMAIDPTVAATLMPREFGSRGTRISTTPAISLASTGKACTYVHTITVFGKKVKDINLDGKLYDITVNAVSFSHTFRKCMPEDIALNMLKDKLEEKKKLLSSERDKMAEELSGATRKLKSLQSSKPQYFGD